jgi:ribosomal protein L9
VKIAEIEALQKHAEAERVEYEKKLSKDVQSLEGARFEMAVRATEKGGLFKSVTPQDVVRLIKNERDVALPEDAVQFPNFKEIGVHPITIRASGLEAHVVLTIIAKA